MYWIYVARCLQWQGCRGSLCKKRLGLPRAGHTCFQIVPEDPSQGKAEPISQAGASRKTYLRMGRKCQTGRGNTKSEKQQREHHGQRKEEVLQAPEQVFALQPMEGPHQSRVKVWEGRSNREKPLHTDYKPPCCFCTGHSLGAEGTEATSGNNKEGREEFGLKLSLGKWGGKVVFLCFPMFVFLLSNTQTGN